MFGAAPPTCSKPMEKLSCMTLTAGQSVIFPSVYGKPGQALPPQQQAVSGWRARAALVSVPLFMAVAQPPKPGPSDGRSAADRLAHCPQRPQRPRVDAERH
jgi:hypothetical protein